MHDVDELRFRSDRLREQSRELRVRSQLWRAWTPRAIPRHDAATLDPSAAADAAGEVQRLLRAERDLERAISDCRYALEQVRRELRWQDPEPPSVVH